ncbi:MAG: efflux transporter periplasmic adaptor subunit, partial [Burkholderiaceae bacterium]
VSPDGKLSPRKVKVGAARGNQWVVLDGLKAGEQVMVDGFQKLMMLPPGTPVKAVPWQAAAAGGAGAGAAAASGAQAAPAAAASSPASAPAAVRQ